MKINFTPAHKRLFRVQSEGITYHFHKKRLAKKKRDEFPVLKKRIEIGPDHWRYVK